MILRRRTLGFVAIFSVSYWISPANSQTKIDTLPLPSTITLNMQIPSPSLPADVAAFFGKWGGKWEPGDLASNLYVESVDANGSASVVYVWGTSYYSQPGAQRINAQISKGVLSWGRDTKFEFKTMPNGSIKGSRFSGGRSNSIIMTRIS